MVIGDEMSDYKNPSADGQTGPFKAPVPEPKVPTLESMPKAETGSGQQKAEPSKTDILVHLLMEREARAAKKEQAEENARLAKEKQRDINAKSSYEDALAKQAKCRHLKGGKNRIRTQAKDHSVYVHRFINNEQIVRCFLCNMKWKQGDTRDTLLRGGKRIPNHTKLGWDDALTMAAESSNQPSSSEIPLNVVSSAEQVAGQEI